MEIFKNYTLKNVTKKKVQTSRGESEVYKAAAMTDDGQEYSVSMWYSDWSTADIKDGVTVRAELIFKENNGYKNWTLKPERTNTLNRKPTGGVNIAKAQERKAEYIAEAQDRKNESIAFFNATNSAIALIKELTKDIPFTNDDDYKRVIRKWREFFLGEWRTYEASDMQDKHNAI